MRVLSRQVDEKRGSGSGLIESLAGAEITLHKSIRLVVGGRRRRFVISCTEN